MRPRVITVLALATLVAGSVPATYARETARPVPGPTPAAPATAAAPVPPAAPPPPPTLATAPVDIRVDDGFFAWALLDRDTGTISGSPNRAATNTSQSMIKAWLVSDYLRRLGDRQPPAARLRDASRAILDSDDRAAETLFRLGGGRPVIDRMIKMCGLTETKPVIPPGDDAVWWSYTAISARDAVRMGECVKNGTAAGPKWTRWVLDEMSRVRGSTAAEDQRSTSGGGRWGIIDGLPREITDQGPISIKNGWTMIGADGSWHLNCLALADDWVLAVLLRYPQRRGLDHGAQLCASVATQLVTPQPGAALKVPVPVGKAARAGTGGAN
ncbi:serine hydrolase [Micromonospora sp. NPDC050417]|uniref:serine hydrolase n=1 Tax=Micromonospora sp. NPDC050417 TaxID=3364280 RepID=UPI003797F8DD